MRRVALTGGIGTGKSYVRGRLAEAGIPTIDADQLARDVVAPGTPALRAIARRFGPGVLGPDGGLDRKALASIVFSDPDARRALEAIVHPAVRHAADAWLDAHALRGTPLAVADIPLLFETGRERDFDAVIVTSCSLPTQLARVIARDGLTEAEARARISAQWPTAEKASRATWVVTTDGDFADTDAAIRRLLDALTAFAATG